MQKIIILTNYTLQTASGNPSFPFTLSNISPPVFVQPLPEALPVPPAQQAVVNPIPTFYYPTPRLKNPVSTIPTLAVILNSHPPHLTALWSIMTWLLKICPTILQPAPASLPILTSITCWSTSCHHLPCHQQPVQPQVQISPLLLLQKLPLPWPQTLISHPSLPPKWKAKKPA